MNFVVFLIKEIASSYTIPLLVGVMSPNLFTDIHKLLSPNVPTPFSHNDRPTTFVENLFHYFPLKKKLPRYYEIVKCQLCLQ